MKSLWLLPALAFLAGEAQAASLPTADQILSELNKARADPHAYAQSLKDYRRHFQGLLYHETPNDGGVITVEGVGAVDDAIAFLERQKPMPPVALTDPLTQAASDLVTDQNHSGKTGHTGSDGSSFGDRIRHRDASLRPAGEALAYGGGSAFEVVRQLIIDDGEPGRGHRDLLLTPDLRQAGVACAGHPLQISVCVLDFATTAPPKAAKKR